MPGQKVRVHAFKITKRDKSQPLEDVLKAIASDNIPSRQRELGREKAKVRMDDVEKISGNRWRFDIVLRRFEGPGRSPDDSRTSAFKIGANDRFGEEVAGLYDVANQRLFLQYNHRGVKLGRLLEYLGLYTGQSANGFDGLFEIDPYWRAKMNSRVIPRVLEAKVAPGHLTKADRAANNSVRNAMRMADHNGANLVRIGLYAGAQKNARLDDSVFDLREWLMRLASKKPEAVDQLSYTGKEKVDDKAEALDLLRCRWHHTEEDMPIGDGRRIDQLERYKLVERAAASF